MDELKWARDAALETVRWSATLPFPDFEDDYEFVALRHPDEYPMNEGRLVSSRGLDIAQEDIRNTSRSTRSPTPTPCSRGGADLGVDGGAYFVGPLARWNLNADRARALVREAAAATGIRSPTAIRITALWHGPSKCCWPWKRPCG